MNIDLEDILLNSHTISHVNEGNCCYGDDLHCRCGWDGTPSDYGKHLLVTLGFTETVLKDWYNRWDVKAFVDAFDDKQREDYLNIWRGPQDQMFFGLSKKEWNALDKVERKEIKSKGKVKTEKFASE